MMDGEINLDEFEDDPLTEDVVLDQTSAEFVAKIVDRTMVFLEYLCDTKLFPYQQESARRIIESLIINDGEEITVIQSRQSGKTEVLGSVVATVMVLFPKLAIMFPDLLGKFAKGVMVGTFAPVENQAETLYGRIVDFLTSDRAMEIMADPEIDDAPTGGGKIIKLRRSGSFCRMQTANPRAKIESKSYHFIVIDEAQHTDEYTVRKSIHPMGAFYNACLVGETPVLLATGERVPIGDLVAKAEPVEVLAVEDEGLQSFRLVPRQVEAFHDNGVKPCLRLTLQGGRQVTCTPNHHFVRGVNTRRGRDNWRWEEAGALEIGHRIAVPWAPMETGTPVLTPLPELLGWLIAEGCLSQSSITVAVSVPHLVDDLAWLVEDFGGLKWSHDGDRSGRISWAGGRRAERGGQGVGTGPKKNPLQMELARLGLLGHKADTKRIPAECFTWDNSALARLLSRMFAGDGCLHHGATPVIKYSTISRGLVEDTQAALDRLGVYSTFSEDWYTTPAGERRRGWVLVIADPVSQKRFLSTVGWLKDSNDYLAFVDALDRECKSRTDLPVRFVRIAKIEDAGLLPTYDLQVAESHNYVAGGIISHNTIVKTGTPDVTKGDFYSAIQHNKRRQTRGRRQNHFEFDWRHCAKYNPNYAKFIAKEKLRIGEDSDEFALSYDCRWLLERGMFTSESQMEALGDKCLLPGAELLTENGWRPIEDVQVGQRVLSMAPDTRRAEWREVTVTTAMDYDGPVLNLVGDVRLTVTANHRVYGSTAKVPSLRAWRAKDLPAEVWFPQTASGVEALGAPPAEVRFPAYNRPDLVFTPTQWAGFLGQWLADGSLVTSRGRNVVKITAIRPDKSERIKALLDEVGVHWWQEGRGGCDTCFSNKALVQTLLPLRGAANKRVPREWLSAGDDVLHALWAGLFTHGDGHWRDVDHCSGTFRSVSPQLADDVAEMAVRLGYRPTTKAYVNSAGNDTWCVSILKKDSDTSARQEWGHYAGPVYCVTVPPYHTMLARQDGAVCWTGNSMEVVKAWHYSPVVVGIDPARKQDSTVVTVVWVDWDRPDEFGFYEHRILNWLEMHGDDWEEQYFRIVEFLSNYDVLRVGVDSQGVGDAVAQRLDILLPSIEVVPMASNSSDQSVRWKHLMQLMQRHKVSFPAHAKTRRLRPFKRFHQQMVDLEKKYQGKYMLAAAPEENEAHDDYPDSLAIACAMTIEATLPEIEVSESPFVTRRR